MPAAALNKTFNQRLRCAAGQYLGTIAAHQAPQAVFAHRVIVGLRVRLKGALVANEPNIIIIQHIRIRRHKPLRRSSSRRRGGSTFGCLRRGGGFGGSRRLTIRNRRTGLYLPSSAPCQQQRHDSTNHPFHRFHSLLSFIYKETSFPYCVTSSRYSMLTQPYHPAYLLSIQVLSSLWPKSCRQVCAGTNCHLL